METKLPTTLIEAIRYFSDPKICRDFVASLRWPDGKPTCPKCQGQEVSFLSTRGLWKCKACKKQFSVKVGTIFEDSALGLDKWLAAIWLVANAKNGISSHELGRSLGVTQKSAWHMLHRIRLAMQTGTFKKIRGTAEADETFVGGKAKFMHKKQREQRIHGRGTVGKTVVQGILQRDTDTQISQVCVHVVPDQKKHTLEANVRAHVAKGAEVFTDTLRSYEGLDGDFVHDVVDHSAGEYTKGKVHTNGMENFWSLTKRMLKGTYVAVAPWHLFRYLDEEVFRFNRRDLNDAGRFSRVVAKIVGKRLTYQEAAGTVAAVGQA
jgi:transposase-like protein